jgi:hypothetical protein
MLTAQNSGSNIRGEIRVGRLSVDRLRRWRRDRPTRVSRKLTANVHKIVHGICDRVHEAYRCASTCFMGSVCQVRVEPSSPWRDKKLTTLDRTAVAKNRVRAIRAALVASRSRVRAGNRNVVQLAGVNSPRFTSMRLLRSRPSQTVLSDQTRSLLYEFSQAPGRYSIRHAESCVTLRPGRHCITSKRAWATSGSAER